jgi:hypothetical protein
MEDLLYRKVRSAATAGWWTILIAVIFVSVQWVGFLAMLHCRPEWMARLWGGASWETIQTMGLWLIGAFKVLIYVMTLLVVWLTIWSRKLRKLQ